jgi:suppressor of ftsI
LAWSSPFRPLQAPLIRREGIRCRIHARTHMVYASNGERLQQQKWLDTVNVPPMGSVDLLMDFTDPIIRGTSLFHCHLLNHEDKGMMAKIVFR